MLSDIEIAQGAKMLPITEIAKNLDVSADDLELYGKYKAKFSEELFDKVKDSFIFTDVMGSDHCPVGIEI